MSNRLTFSLASLILILGLAFAPMSIMAHEATDENTDTADDTSLIHAVGTDATHKHPMITVTIEDADPTMDGIQVVNKADAPSFDAAITDPVTIEFDVTLTVPVGARDGSPTTEVSETTFATPDEDHKIVAYKPDYTSVGTTIVFGTWAQAAATEKLREWTATVTLTLTTGVTEPDSPNATKREAAYNKIIADAIAAGITIDITLLDDVIQTTGLLGGPMAGQSNLKSTTTVTVIASARADKTAPTVEISSIPESGEALPTADSDTTGAKKGKVVFVFDFSEALGTDDGHNLQTTDLVISGAPSPAEDDLSMSTLDADEDEHIYHLALTPDEDATEVTVKLQQGSVSDTAGNALKAAASYTYRTPDYPDPDTTPPMVMIKAPTEAASDGSVVFTIDFDEAPGEGANAFVLGDLTIDGEKDGTTPTLTKLAKVPAGVMVGEKAAAERYTLTVMPGTTGTVKVSLNTGSVGDAEGNLVDVTGANATATFDGTAPTVEITAPDAPETDGNLMFTFEFSEPIASGTFTSSDIRGSGYSIVATVPMKMESSGTDTETETWTVKVTPNAANTKVTVAIDAGAVDDMNGNALAAGMTATYTPAAPAMPADLTATAGVQKVTLKWTVVEGASYQYRKKSGDDTFAADGSDYMDIAAANLKAVSGSTTMKMFEVTGLTGGTEYTFQVRVKESGDIPASDDSPVMATPTAPDTPPTLVSTDTDISGITVPGKSYVILARDNRKGLPASAIPANTATGSSPTTIVVWSKMPDLEDLFYEGGSLLLTTSNTKLDRDGKSDTATEAAKERDVLVTEIMAAVNTAKIGGDGELSHQWIELYNNLPVSVTVKLESKSGTTLPEAGANRVALDLVSNTKTPRWVFDLGSNGTDDGVDDTADLKPFVSFHRSNRGAAGHVKGHWKTSTEDYFANHKGTPGDSERSQHKPPDQTKPTYDVVINEIGNNTDDDHDWIELRGPAGTNLKKWQLWAITGSDGTKTKLVEFPDNDNHKIPDTGILLIVNDDPYEDPDHPLAAGKRTHGGHPENRGITTRYYVAGDSLALANGEVTLLLRNKNDDKYHEGIIDLTGTVLVSNIGLDTQVWPLAATTAGNDNNGSGDVINNDKDNKTDYFTHGIVYQRIGGTDKAADKGGTGKHVWSRVGYNGIGYKRSARKTAENGGTPGYPNDAANKVNQADLADGATVTISEIMYAKGRNLPQWIELYNSSSTQSVHLNEWKLKIEHSRDATDVDIRIPNVTTNNLGDFRIQPNQTVLLVSYIPSRSRVSRAGLNGLNDFPPTRVINLWGHKDKFEVPSSRTQANYRLLSETAFKITLMDKSGAAVDVAGNLGANGTAMWELPMADGNGRSSIIRRYDDGEARNGMAPAWSGEGTIKAQELEVGSGPGTAAWVLASESPLTEARLYRGDVFYGASSDVGTPGYRAGGALPVSLSKFRPERLDSGEIVIRWITESELNNAGFNILRSEKRDGEFKQINTKLIAGQGTTSARTTYTHIDTSAKPNVIYYYQIQDVSLDGQVQTLRTSRLKGHISPTGKLTTTWGKLKALQ